MTVTDDPLVLDSRTASGPDRFRFRTAQGVHSHDEFRTGDLLALDALWERDLGRLLTVESGYGVLGTILGGRADSVTMAESSARAAALCERNAAANGVDAAVELVPAVDALGSEFDTAVYVPKPYVPLELAQQRIVDALERLHPGGALYVAATTQTGLSRFESCLDDHARTSSVVAGRGDWTLLRGTRPRRFDPPACTQRRQVTATVDGTSMTLVTAPGLFAPTGLDDGTRLLAETVPVSGDERVLDLCCGYGPLGTYASLEAGADVCLTDDDRRATACADRTLDANGVTGAVVTGDGVTAVSDRTFDLVLCNPPTHAGDSVLADLFGGAAAVLAPGGRLAFVHHRRLDLSPHLDRFARVERAATGAEHVVRVAR